MLRFGFVTCVELGLSCMDAIYHAGGSLAAAFTLRDDLAAQKSGRIYLDGFCAQHGIPLRKVRNVNDPDALAMIRGADLDWLFIVGWSQIARAEVLSATRRGALGMHPTLLPEGRGRAAVPWAILKGLERTGVTLFKLDEGVDTGPIAAQVVVPIEARETATTLYAKVSAAHRSLIEQAWPSLVADVLRLAPQDESRATVWPGRTPEDGRVTADLSPAMADRLVRAVTRPYPGAFVDAKAARLRIWCAALFEGERPDEVHVNADGTLVVPVRGGGLIAQPGEWELG